MIRRAKTYLQRQPRPQPEPDLRPSARRRGYDAKWEKVRKTFITHHPLCAFCQALATVVDHIKPLNQDGARLSSTNLRSVCTTCHARLTANLRRTGRNEMPDGQ
jgi:5-methylcytosine-specific restriction protein A